MREINGIFIIILGMFICLPSMGLLLWALVPIPKIKLHMIVAFIGAVIVHVGAYFVVVK